MTSLQKKGCALKWTAECQQRFEKLKHLVTTATVLKVEDLEKPCMVFMDASKEGVGGVLT